MPAIELSRQVDAYFDFIVDLKGAVGQHLYGPLQNRYEQQVSPAQTPEEIGASFENYLPYQFNSAVKRKAQEMMWQGIIEAYAPYQFDLSQKLNQLHPEAGATLQLDPKLVLPEYLARHEFHIKPGGYYGKGDLSPWMSLLGTNIYFRKTTANYRLQKALAAAIPPGNYQRALDLGCTTGGSTFALKMQFPQAEVHGLDAVASNLKMSYQLAVEQELEVHLSQRNAEDTGFAANSFDLVFCYILFHELPFEAMRRVLSEAYRILKPGGLMFCGDVTPFRQNEPWRSYVAAWEVENNGEPYWREFLEQTYLPDEFKAAGFQEVQEFGVGASRLSPKFPWVTLGYKP